MQIWFLSLLCGHHCIFDTIILPYPEDHMYAILIMITSKCILISLRCAVFLLLYIIFELHSKNANLHSQRYNQCCCCSHYCYMPIFIVARTQVNTLTTNGKPHKIKIAYLWFFRSSSHKTKWETYIRRILLHRVVDWSYENWFELHFIFTCYYYIAR